MPRPALGLAPDARLRSELAALLRGGNAHLDPDAVLAGVPPSRVNDRAEGDPHSLWDLVEHLRFTQADILAFCRPGYVEPVWPGDYWPAAPATVEAWLGACDALRADREALVALAETGDLFAEFTWAPGYTLVRELVLAADHTAYHLGQVVSLRRRLGLWPPDGP